MSLTSKRGKEFILNAYEEIKEKYTNLKRNFDIKINSIKKEYKQKTADILLENQSLKNKKKCYIKEIEGLRNKMLSQGSLLNENTKLKTEIDSLKECLSSLMYKHGGVLKEYFNNTNDDESVSFDSVILSLKYMFLFRKLFELNIFDFIIDRQSPDGKSVNYDSKLINLCNSFSSDIIIKYLNNDIKTKDFKKEFYTFARPYLERRYAEK